MGFFGKLKKVVHAVKLGVDIITLGQASIIEKEIEIGGKVVKAVIDVNNEIVRIGEEVFRAAPGELFYPGVGPLAGLLKNEVEDELILLNPFGLVPSIDVFFGVDPLGAVIVVGDLIGKVQHRTMFREELRIARYVFRNSIKHMDEIILTNLSGLQHRAFTAPAHGGHATIHLGRHYVHNARIDNIPLLLHELTHVWQIERSILKEVAVCRGLTTAAIDWLGWDQYSFEPGSQWSSYSTEQQGSIVEAWARGTTRLVNKGFDFREAAKRDIFTIGSPLFRYINGNIRRSNNSAKTESGRSLKQLLADSNYQTTREMLWVKPEVWWTPTSGF